MWCPSDRCKTFVALDFGDATTEVRGSFNATLCKYWAPHFQVKDVDKAAAMEFTASLDNVSSPIVRVVVTTVAAFASLATLLQVQMACHTMRGAEQVTLESPPLPR